jgi:hypothetical protein
MTLTVPCFTILLFTGADFINIYGLVIYTLGVLIPGNVDIQVYSLLLQLCRLISEDNIADMLTRLKF